MTFRWREYVTLAEDLKERTDEAALRSSISRAYYGAFCISRNYLGLSHYKRGDVHQKVIDELNGSDDEEIFIAGQSLDILRKERNLADYDGIYDIAKVDIGRLINKANRVIEIIDELES